MSDKLISISFNNETTTHSPDWSGDFDTLCGLDISGTDIDFDFAGVQVFPGGRNRVNCGSCKSIWQLCQRYDKADFDSTK